MRRITLFSAGALTALALCAGCTGNTGITTENEAPEISEDLVTNDTTEDIASEENDVSNEKQSGEESSAKEENTSNTVDSETIKTDLEDGEYEAVFDTDSSMFHVNETCDGKGILTVKDGEMSIHISLPSKSILNLYPGLAEDAQKDGAVLLEPTIDTVKYDDGLEEEVHGFDIPVPYLNDEFDVALIGTKGKWYDHKVSVTLVSENSDETLDLEDGEYTIEVELEGGSGKASITSPATLKVKDGKVIGVIEWSSPYYDYMVLNGDEVYNPVNTEGNSVFEIPVNIEEPNEVIADTVAMSKPHEIEYTLTFKKESLKKK